MRAKIIILVMAGLLLLAALPVRAQKPEDPEARLKKLQAVLNLSAQQVSEIRRILQRSGGPDEMGPPPDEGIGRPPMDGGMPPMGMADREIERVLSPEQVEKFRVFQKNERLEQELTELTNRLRLTPEQKKIFEDLNNGRRGPRKSDSGL